MKILIVDDSKTIRNMQKNVLAELGHTEIIEAGDGREALRLLGRENVHLMLVDWDLPGMDGVGLVRKVREGDAALPIVICATEAQKESVSEAIKAGADDYVIKPFSAVSLTLKVGPLLRRVAARA